MTTVASPTARTLSCAIVGGMPRRAPVLLSTSAAVIALTIGSTCPMLAQEHVTFQGDFLFYGDNTEFRNAFREGETILGTAVWAAAVFTITERVRVSLGAFGNVRFGDDDSFEMARPIVSLRSSDADRRSCSAPSHLPGSEIRRVRIAPDPMGCSLPPARDPRVRPAVRGWSRLDVHRRCLAA